MKRFLFLFCAFIGSFGVAFSQQDQFFSVIPDEDRVLIEQARASYNNFLEEVRGLGVQCKDPQSPDIQIARLQPLIEKAQKSLTEIKAELNKKLVLLPVGDDLRQAYILMTRELSSYCDTLSAFSVLKKNATSKITETRSLFTVISYAFGFYENMFQLYKYDHETSFFREGVLNMGLRAALAAWYFSLQKADIGSGLLSNALQGRGDIGPFSQLASFGALPAATGVFFNPSQLNQGSHPVVRGFGKMAAALIYYRLLHGHISNKATAGYTQKKDGKLIPVDKEPEMLAKNQEFLPSGKLNYSRMQKVIFGAFNETQRALFDELYQKMRKDFYPQEIEFVEKVSMGIIKPELIGEIFETLFPLILLNQKEFINPVVPAHPDNVNKRRDILLNLLTDKNFEKVKKYSTGENIQAKYVEFRIISYICASFGRHWGGFFANKYKKQIGALASKGASKTVDLCANMHLISKDMAELIKECKDQLGKEMEIAMSELKARFKGIFVTGTLERTMLVWILELRGDVTTTDSIDSLAVTRELLHFLLALLAENRLISYLNAADVEREFEKNPAHINEAIDTVVKIVENNIVAAVGGMVGSKLVPWIARCVMQIHGPFYAQPASV